MYCKSEWSGSQDYAEKVEHDHEHAKYGCGAPGACLKSKSQSKALMTVLNEDPIQYTTVWPLKLNSRNLVFWYAWQVPFILGLHDIPPFQLYS